MIHAFALLQNTDGKIIRQFHREKAKNLYFYDNLLIYDMSKSDNVSVKIL